MASGETIQFKCPRYIFLIRLCSSSPPGGWVGRWWEVAQHASSWETVFVQAQLFDPYRRRIL